MNAKETILNNNMTIDKYMEILKLIRDKKEGLRDLDWSDICTMYSLDLNKDSLRKMNDGLWGGAFVYKFLEEMYAENEASPNKLLLKEIEEKKKELSILKIQYQDQKREYNKYLRADARWQHLLDVMKDSIVQLPKIEQNEIKKVDGDTEASLILSDWHLGLECKNHWNTFNKEVALDRVSKLKRKVVNYCSLHNVKILHIEILGDMVNGFIHLGNRVEAEEDVISQVMFCSEVVSNLILDLSQCVEQVMVHSVNGNHGRVSPNKNESIETENFERLITWYMQSRLSNLSNVKIYENEFDDTISFYTIKDKNIFSVHGHLDSLGDVVNRFTRMFKVTVDEVHLGHFHTYYEKDDYGSTVVVNGTLSGVDTYAKNIRKTGEPMQVLRIYGDEDVCTYKIKL